MNVFLSTVLVVASMAQSSGVAVQPSSSNVVVQSSPTVPQSLPQARSTGLAISSFDSELQAQPFGDQARATVLVIPTPELPAESLAELTEDLTVMCRIFDKALPSTRASVAFSYVYGNRGDPLRYALGGQTAATQGLYLEGYGALFFVQVDYPLVPPEQKEQAQSKPQESGDPVWSQTIDEMTGRQSDEGREGRAGPVYDAQRVESLKKALIRTLAHATNIRTRRPQDNITLVVGSFDDTRPAYPGAGAAAPDGRHGVVRFESRTGSGTAPRAAALMVLRVAKSDVDAFAQGQLTLPQFTEKVQTLWSGAQPQRREPATPQPAASTPR